MNPISEQNNKHIPRYIPPYRRSSNQQEQKTESAARSTLSHQAWNRDNRTRSVLYKFQSVATTEELRIVGSWIKRANPTRLLSLAKNPVIINNKEIILNDIHWAQILKRLTNISSLQKRDKRKISQELVMCMRAKLKICTLGASAQIIHSLGALGIDDQDTVNWIFPKLREVLKELNRVSPTRQKELFMILCGIQHILNTEQQRIFLNNLTPCLLSSGKPTLLMNEMRSNTLVALASCCAWAREVKTSLHSEIWKRIRQQTLPLNDALFLLCNGNLKHCEGMEDFLKNLESRIIKVNLDTKNFIHAWIGFARQGYFPGHLEARACKSLSTPERSFWDNISLFYGFALLGDMSNRESFRAFLQEINEKANFKAIYPSDKVKLLYIASIYLKPNDQEAGLLQKMIDGIDETFSEVDHMSIMESATILKLNCPSIHCRKEKITFSPIIFDMSSKINQWLKKHLPLQKFTLQMRKKVLADSYADIVIDGFKDGLGYAQTPVVINFNGKGQFQVNDTQTPLGKNIRRFRVLSALGYRVWNFDKRSSQLHGDIEQKLNTLLKYRPKEPFLNDSKQ